MPLEVTGRILPDIKFSFPFRIIISGSSQTGKTYFAKKLLSKNLFIEKPSSVKYYYPCYLNIPPVNWHRYLDIPVSYNIGLPSKEDILDFQKNRVIVLDDLFD